jgi:beta-galactosidase/beta-glucuronidase
MLRSTYLHSGWQFAEKGWLCDGGEYAITPDWLDAQVPGHVHLDLLRHGVIADPFSGMAELGCQWVDEREWSYRISFEWTPDGELPRQSLFFEGLDTVCKVFLNDREIAEHDNMFLPLEVDVTELLVAGTNTVRVDFQSAVSVGNARRAEYFAKEGLPLETRSFTERAFVRKAQYMFGWDWGPRLVGCGIWKPVHLIEFGASQPSSVEGGKGGGRDTSDRPDRPVVKLLREPDQWGESFEFEIDGKKIWMKGANWIPDHSFPATITRAQLRDRLEKCVDMGFNMLRVWGGGFYESDDFYELCEELGIWVWQDFPFACSYYPDDDDFKSMMRPEAEYHVARLRQYACLVLWCGNNENETLHYDRWAGDTTPDRYHGEAIYQDVLREVVERLDPNTPYIPTSPIGNAHNAGPNSGGFGDQHCWDVWHGRGDWKHYAESTGRFSSEYGFASSCSLATWDKVLDDWAEDYPFDLDDPVLNWHDKTRKGRKTFVDLVKLHYPDPKTLADWVYYSQLNQRDAMRAGVEHYRRSEFCRGSLIWQLNDCWPVQSWSILDSEGHYKAVAYELRRLYDDTLLSIERKNDLIKVHAVNDGEVADWSISLDAYNLQTGEHIEQLASAEIQIGEDARKVVLEASLKGLSVPDTIIVASASIGAQSLPSHAGERQGEGLLEDESPDVDPLSAFAWHLLAEPKQARFDPPEPILASIAEEGYLTLQTSQPVVDLMVTDEDDVANLIDNFATVVQPGTFALRYLGSGDGLKARSLAGWHQVILTRSPL